MLKKNIIREIVEFIFIVNLFRDINVVNIFYKFSQT